MHDLSVNAIITRGSRKWFGFSSIPTTLWIATVLSHVRPAGMFGLVRNLKNTDGHRGPVWCADVTSADLSSRSMKYLWRLKVVRQFSPPTPNRAAGPTRSHQVGPHHTQQSKSIGENNGRQKCETGRQPNRIPAKGENKIKNMSDSFFFFCNDEMADFLGGVKKSHSNKPANDWWWPSSAPVDQVYPIKK